VPQRDREQLQRRTIRVLVAAQVFAGAGFFLGFAVSVLLARELTDSESLIGLPVALAVAAAAVAAGPFGTWMGRSGRRPALVTGQLIGALGAASVVLSARAESFVLFCVAMCAFGVGNAANLFARYAASDLPPADQRGRAISSILLAMAAGAVLGPNLAEAAGGLGDELGVVSEAAPFALSALLLAIAAAVIAVALRPDPLLAARALPADGSPPGGPATEAEAVSDDAVDADAHGADQPLRWSRMALTGAAAIVLANLVMVSIMTMTPIHLDDADQSLAVVGLVISLHVAGMFLPSPVTGVLVDRVGRLPVIAASGAVLIAAGGLALPSSGHDTVLVIAALVLLGIGWNFGLVGGSALLTDSVPLAARARAQGRADMAMGAAGALGSLASGPAMEVGGFGALAVFGACVGAGLVLIALRAGLFEQPAAEAA
jgi:MFS family permease